MSETVLAHFPHLWEAEFAQGFLEDAGVPSRVVGDGPAGGIPYVGGLSGASLVVSSSRAEEATAILEMAGVLKERGALTPDPEDRLAHLSPAAKADHRDLTEQLAAARKAELKHGIRTVLGVSPAAVIPLVGLALEENIFLVAVLCVLVVMVEGWRWIQAGKRGREIRIRLAALEEQADA